MKNPAFQDLSREQLLDLIEMYCKEWSATDGLWFQSVERKWGMDEAIDSDIEMWKTFTVLEAKRIKDFLGLPDGCGLPGLEKALMLRTNAVINETTIHYEGDHLIYRTEDCRVQTARSRKNMEWHPCHDVGLEEYTGFGRTIDPRIKCRCISCYPQITDKTCACAWEYWIEEEDK